jgi:adenine-specific DNA-methyltransferase
VTSYIPFTKRMPLLESFTPDESEDRLYALVSEYLMRDNLQALPASQRSLMTLVLRKLLASSTFAIAGALTSIAKRLRAKLPQHEVAETLADDLSEDYEALGETAEEWADDPDPQAIPPQQQAAIEQEIADLESFAQLASSIKHNAKGKVLVQALNIAFAKARQIGAAEKAIIFTESRRTQDYLLRVLADSPFAEGIVLFNGSNTDDRSKVIYSAWLQRHKGTDRVTGSRTADMRSALVDYFHKEGRIMIATEAGAEGINLQFCSLVVNYDLPWNPQRIEQRIGRCHRYGQKHDVVVVNFLNRNNAADRRVFELLSEKFQLFEGVFGASDEVLGAIESGVDFEKRIADIYQRCRQPEQIKTAFDQLQLELSLEIDEAMTSTRRKLLENFDDDVRDKLRIRDEASRANLNRFERWLMQVTEHELGRHAEFLSDSAFRLLSNPFAPLNGDIPLGLYELPRRTGEAHLYRLNHPLAESVVIQARTRDLPPATIRFNYNGRIGKSSLLEPIVGSSGWLSLSLLSVEALDQAEDHLIFAGITDLGIALDQETVSRLFGLPGNVEASLEPPEAITGTLKGQTDERQSSIQKEITERNLSFFAAEADKLDGWADDLKLGLEREIKELEREIKEARRAAISALTLQDKLGVQKQIRALESQRNDKRRALFDAQDAVDKQRDTLIAQIESKLTQHMDLKNLFFIRWTLA